MTVRSYLTQEVLKGLFSYDKETGHLIWKVTRGRAAKGSIAGCPGTRGRVVKVLGRMYYVKRLVYLYHHDCLPPYITFVDGDCTNTKIKNLRRGNK